MKQDESEEPRPDSTARGARRGAKRPRRTSRDVTPDFEAGTVRAIRALDTRGARFEIDIDGRNGIVSAELIGEFRVAAGRPIDAAAAAKLSQAVRTLSVFDQAVAILARRPRSSRDLRLRLLRAGATEADVAAALDRLQRLGLQNDAEFARHLAETRASVGGLSKRRLQQELRRRGLPQDITTGAVTAALDAVGLDEEGAALAAARKRMRALRSLDPAVARRRLYAFLARRGYDSAIIARVTRDVLGAADDE